MTFHSKLGVLSGPGEGDVEDRASPVVISDSERSRVVRSYLRRDVYRQLGPGSSGMGELVTKTRVVEARYCRGTVP